MKIIATILATCLGLAARAAILGNTEVTINFTNPAVPVVNATWAFQAGPMTNTAPAALTVTAAGLGWEGDTNTTREMWVQSDPVAIGESWRAPQSTLVTVEINPPVPPDMHTHGVNAKKPRGNILVRYSPDRQHWSTWHALLPMASGAGAGRYHGVIQVPPNEITAYTKHLGEYAALDVPWKSDEEAAVKWILQQHPDYFAHTLPFIGYVEIRLEEPLPAGEHIEKIHLRLGWGVDALASAPKDPAATKERQVPWRFVGKGI